MLRNKIINLWIFINNTPKNNTDNVIRFNRLEVVLLKKIDVDKTSEDKLLNISSTNENGENPTITGSEMPVLNNTNSESVLDYKTQVNKNNLYHLGILLSRLSIFCFSVIVFVTIGQLFAFIAVGLVIAIIFIIWLFLTLATIGLIYVIVPNFSKILTFAQSLGDNLNKISQFLFGVLKLLPIALIVSLASGILSIILLAKTAPGRHKALKIVLIILMSISAILTIVGLIALGGAK